MLYHAFADDTQIYLFLRQLNSWGESVASVQKCIWDISCWMQLNDDKTEILVLTHKKSDLDIGSIDMRIRKGVMKPSPIIKNLSVVWTPTWIMVKQARAVAKACNFHLSGSSQLRGYLTEVHV